ncbi:MAG: SDR family oxidoreductase [Burkholderiaceae bacterium]|nr:SDR family oxidoreductase [Burkholderiaceae bacterium]
MLSFDFSQRVAVVTGGGNGIGRAIATCLGAQGARVHVLDIDLAAARQTAAACDGIAVRCDVADAAAVRDCFAAIGRVDFLINNAGVVSGPGQPFTNNTEDEWDRTFAINVKSIRHTAAAVSEQMRARRDGRIVNITSITGVIAAPFMPPYSVSKSAANGLTRVLARDFAPSGVTVNAICPGFVWSPLWEDLGEVMAQSSGGAQGANAREVFQWRIDSLVPMKRAQSPEEIAATVAFFCSDGARNITGQVLSVDGGVTI